MTETESIIEGEVVESGTDLEPAAAAPATLFRTDEPDLIIARATGVADALARVLRTQKDEKGDLKLISNISGKEYVKVEGWTLCGSMLGVFAVIEWTRPVEGGWEARAEARTMSGAVIGAAEAECLTSEKEWGPTPTRGKPKDDYARRSMAQTRAVSKALRAPLGFIVTLAGFEATPSDEIPREGFPDSARSQPERRVDRAGTVEVPKSWPAVEKSVRTCDNPDEAWPLWEAFLRAATYHAYGYLSLKELPSSAERKVMLQKAGTAAVWLHENVEPDGPFTFFLEEHMRAAWEHATGARLEIPDYTPEPPLDPKAQEEIDRLAAESFADPA